MQLQCAGRQWHFARWAACFWPQRNPFGCARIVGGHMALETTPPAESTGPTHDGVLRGDALGTAGIAFLVLAAVAPLTGMVVVAGLGIALGNGGGMPGSFVIAGA